MTRINNAPDESGGKVNSRTPGQQPGQRNPGAPGEGRNPGRGDEKRGRDSGRSHSGSPQRDKHGEEVGRSSGQYGDDTDNEQQRTGQRP